MDENDLARIEQLLIKVFDSKLGDLPTKFDVKLEDASVKVDAKLENIFAKFDAKLQHIKCEIISRFDHSLALQTEALQHGLTIVAEGNQMLSKKLERVELNLVQRLANISADLAAHRSDTEAHHGIYRVKEV